MDENITLLERVLNWLDALVKGATTRSGIADWFSIALGLASIAAAVFSALRARRSTRAADQSTRAAEQAQKAAQEAAQEAAQRVRDTLVHSATLTNFSAVMTTMAGLKQHHLMMMQMAPETRKNWCAVLPDRYATLQEHQREILSMHPRLSDKDKGVLQGAISQFRDIEMVVWQALRPDGQLPDLEQLNTRVVDQIDLLSPILNALKYDVGSR